MDTSQFLNVSGFRRVLVLSGLSAIVVAIGLFIGHLAGLLPSGFFVLLGQSDLRSIASLAVAGCLVVAIGYGQN